MSADVQPVPKEEIPLVSIVIPAYNGAGTIQRTLRSVLAQDYPSLELVVVDDASAEPAAALVEATVAGHDLRARVVRHSANEGLSRTLNDGWRLAAGELVLIVHQDIELLGTDWVRRAVAMLKDREGVQVVTCNYGIPARGELTFAARTFGFLRRQFHHAPASGQEFVTFTEFKCDLVRKVTLERIGGFPTNFRLAGEDILVSYRIRRAGGRILKAFDLRVIQRFEGTAESVRGNLWKEYRFGMAFAGVLIAFSGYAFRDLGASAYSRSRSLHRALQPPVALAGVALLIAALITGSIWAVGLLLVLVAARFVSYAIRLWPDFRRVVRTPGRTLEESLGAAALGLVTDIVYTAGLTVGLVRAALGEPV